MKRQSIAAAVVSAFLIPGALDAKYPLILAGNGVIRQGAADALVTFVEVLRIPVANTFMAKGVMPFSNPFCIGTIGLEARDLDWYAFEKADVVICVGYDMVEYHPDMWNPNNESGKTDAA
jgi:acetolactate synthase I/II/III large subunit